jgi:hypothetical protein
VSWLTAAHPRWWTYLSGQVKVRFGELTESIEYIKSGKLRKKGRQRKAQVVAVTTLPALQHHLEMGSGA